MADAKINIRFHHLGGGSQLPVIPQLANGPCCVLAALEAFTLKHLYWPKHHRTSPKTGPLTVNAAFGYALGEVLYRAAVTPSYGEPAHSGLVKLQIVVDTEDCGIRTFTFDNVSNVESAQSRVQALLDLQGGAPISASTVVWSLVLTRGTDRVARELKGNASLPGGWKPPPISSLVAGEDKSCGIPAGFCEDALLALVLLGRATNSMSEDAYCDWNTDPLNQLETKGPSVEIGLLCGDPHDSSSFFLRQPNLPIWLVLRGGHCTTYLCPEMLPQGLSNGTWNNTFFDGIFSFLILDGYNPNLCIHLVQLIYEGPRKRPRS